MITQRVGCRHAVMEPDGGERCPSCLRLVSALDVVQFANTERLSSPNVWTRYGR